jgi:hypothetical protein
MQASLAVVGSVAGFASAWLLGDIMVGMGALLLAAVVPFTLLVILPTNTRLLDPTLNAGGAEASRLLSRWGRLHAVRSVLGIAAFVIFSVRLASGAAV